MPKIDDTSKDTEWANLAIEQIALGKKEFGFLAEEDCPNTVKEAMKGRNGNKLWKKK